MTDLVCLGGTGDTYLVSALARAYGDHHGRRAELVVKGSHAAVPEMFGLSYRVDDALIAAAEGDRALQLAWDNRLDGETFYAHPCFRGGRLDDLTVAPGHASQADMYRSLLGLPLDAPLALPEVPRPAPRPYAAVLVPEAVSWPNSHPSFWPTLASALEAAGWDVRWNDPAWSLADLLRECAAAALVAGPQCGVMSILCAAEFPCRKALLTPSIDDGPGFPVGNQVLRRTYPYAHVTRFTGNDYRVLERALVSPSRYASVVDSVLRYAALPYDPVPVRAVAVALSASDLLDRLAVLSVKMERFPDDRRALVEREYRRLEALRRGADLPEAVEGFYARLRAVHSESFDAIEAAVRRAPESDPVFRANRDRVRIRAAIDDICGAPYGEVKSYYGD